MLLLVLAGTWALATSSASARAFTPVLQWSWTSSAVEPYALNVMMTPSVIDLNGDDAPEVVFGSTASTDGSWVKVGFLRALDGRTGSELFTVNRMSPEDLRINAATSVATGDIDLDGRPEIIACDSSGHRLIAFEHDGAFKWRSVALEAIDGGGPAIADLDQDGVPEIVLGRQVLSNTGVLRWTGSGGRASQGLGPLSLVADVDLDGGPEIVAGNTVYRADGSIRSLNTGLPDGHNAVANFDEDSQAEIVLVSGGRVWLLEHNLTVKWGPVSIPGGGRGGPPTIADYDGDGQPEIGVAGALRYAVFETDGSLKWQAVTQDVSSNVTGSSVFDFDGDGAAEVVYKDELQLYIYQGTDGTILFQTPLSSCTWHEYPLVAEVDGDHSAELLAVANNNCGVGPQRGVFVYGDPSNTWVPTRAIWNQHTYHITNVERDGRIPVTETNNWQVRKLNNFRLNEYGPNEGPPCGDGLPPVTTAQVLPAPNPGGWNNTDVTVTLTASSACGVKEVTFALAGGQTGGDTVAGGVASFTVSAEGSTTVTFFAVDIGGNEEAPKTIVVRIDTTAPAVSGAPPASCSLWPPNHKLVQVGVISASDLFSGTATFNVTAISSEPLNPHEPDIVITGAGLEPRAVQLRAERTGAGTGRAYTITTVVTDAAGNTATATSTCSVAHDLRK
jgi:hypothetical protein